ncbi:hypothetical protein GQ53DRAFT_882329, partial [Thozetella sp. PMI_491]
SSASRLRRQVANVARPLKVQIGIRDHWSKEDGPLRTAIKGLNDLVGYGVTAEPEWQLLLTELGEFYDDKTVFVSVVAGCVQAWVKSAKELLDDEANEEWTEKFLDKVKSCHTIRLYLEVGVGHQGSTYWAESRQAFVISLPRKQIFQPAELFPTFRGNLLACFDEKDATVSKPPAADDWADVEMDSATGRAAVVERPAPARGSSGPAGMVSLASDFLPTVSALPRPDVLLLRPPYHLQMHVGGNEVEIQCSHSPTLQLLSDYLKKWCRVNHNDTRAPPAVDVKLHQSAFGLTEMFDRLELSTKENRFIAQFHITSPMIVALIEGVLGYKLISTYAGTWNFRREVEFKSL